MNGLYLQAEFKGSTDIDTQADHCHDDNEVLIRANMSWDTDPEVARGEVVDSFMENITYGGQAKKLNEFVAQEVFDVITKAVDDIHVSDLITDEHDECDRVVWIRLHW